MSYNSTSETRSYWGSRLSNAQKLKDEWNSLYKCDVLEQYYKGNQWKHKKDFYTINYNPYTINMFYSTIKIKLASLLFQRPSFLVSPRPGNSSWDMDTAVRSSELKQDTLNTIIQNPNVNFSRVIKRAAQESFFRFGMVEVGYAADWRNPNKAELLLSNHGEEGDTAGPKQPRIVQNNELPINERFYVKRIPAKRFLVSVCEAEELSGCEWVGYYEYFYTNRLKKTPGINWPKDGPYDGDYYSADAFNSGIVGPSSASSNSPALPNMQSSANVSKCWHLWDIVAGTRCLYLDGYFEEPLWEGEFERLPFIDLRWDDQLDIWYPMPPAYQWLSPQDEINEAREQTRSFRRRFTRKFQAVKGSIEEEEKEKFAAGPDGVIIEVKQVDAITPIQNPEQGHTAENALLIAKDDFNIISGTSAEARGQSADRQTATQAKIIDARTQIRESAEGLDFSVFLCQIGREILAQAGEKLSEGLWIKYTTNPAEADLMSEIQMNQPIYKYIKAQDLSDGYDFDVDIDVMNQTPAAMQQAQQSFVSFLTLVQNFPAVSLSPVLIREAAYRSGYRNERVIHQMQQAAMLAMAAKAYQTSGGQPVSLPGGGGPGNNSGNQATAQIAQMQSPTIEQTQQQLTQQLGQ